MTVKKSTQYLHEKHRKDYKKTFKKLAEVVAVFNPIMSVVLYSTDYPAVGQIGPNFVVLYFVWSGCLTLSCLLFNSTDYSVCRPD